MSAPLLSIAPFLPQDMAAMSMPSAQPELTGDRRAIGRALSATGRCFTARDGAGAILLCGGALESHPGYATLWAAIAPQAGPAMLAITRRVRQFVAGLPHRRIDAVVRGDNAAGHRWMAALGFAGEAWLANYFEDGGDAMIYRRAG